MLEDKSVFVVLLVLEDESVLVLLVVAIVAPEESSLSLSLLRWTTAG